MVDEHNKNVQSLIFTYNSLLTTYPVSYIFDCISTIGWDRICEIYTSVKEVYAYVFPHSFVQKNSYDTYKKDLENIIKNYDIIKKQKEIILSVQSEIEGLPDCYLDEESASIALAKAKKLVKEYHSFHHKYFDAPVINTDTIEKHNKTFIEKHLTDTLFDEINGKSLDEEQRRAILCDAKSNLTIAGAGSGKTLTICGKVKYLLENGIARKDDILLLSYSRASADDLTAKVSDINEGLAVETFHSLGFKILAEMNGKKKAVEEQLKACINRFFEEELVNHPKIAEKIFQYIALYFYTLPTHPKKYKNEGEIFKELKTLNFRTLKNRLSRLSENKEKHETLKNEFVKSNEELVIANYLFINGIRYEYERPYEIDTSTLEKRQYTPDFYLSDYGIYIEHYGINRNGQAPQYDKKTSDEYVHSMQWKRQIHEKNKTCCIETYSYEFKEGTIFENLKKRLTDKHVAFHPLTAAEVYNALHNIYRGRDFTAFFNLITTFISLYKAQMRNDQGFSQFKSQLNDHSYDTNRAYLFLDICKDIYNYYMYHLREADKIDFDDMILQSTDFMDHTPNFKYKYIIVDEFQDISQSRTRFLQKLITHGNAKLFAVGDDWQAIYRFAGCDINIFLDFEHIFPGAKLNYITSTHRNSSELQFIIEPFITANPYQYKKHIRSDKHQDKPVRIVFYNRNKSLALTKALKDIAQIDVSAKVLILGRNRADIDAFVCKDIQVYEYKKIFHRSYPDLHLIYSTIHGAKGLESDFVILISGEDAQNGFPNKTEDDHVLTLILGKKNDFRYAEERRLFYVALTRTKSIVYILSEKEKSSEFITEIKNQCYIIYSAEETEVSEKHLCPWCKSGQLVLRKPENSEHLFYGCSNYPYCTYKNNHIEAVQSDYRCPACGDFLVLRSGKYGTFWGCQNYPRCKYTQQDTPSVKPDSLSQKGK